MTTLRYLQIISLIHKSSPPVASLRNSRILQTPCLQLSRRIILRCSQIQREIWSHFIVPAPELFHTRKLSAESLTCIEKSLLFSIALWMSVESKYHLYSSLFAVLLKPVLCFPSINAPVNCKLHAVIHYHILYLPEMPVSLTNLIQKFYWCLGSYTLRLDYCHRTLLASSKTGHTYNSGL